MTTLTRSSRVRQALDVVVAVVLIVAGGMVIWRNWPPPPPGPPLPDEPVSIAEAATAGEPTAQLVVIEYADYECPYCRQFALTVWPDLDRKYIRSGQLRWVFKNFPIDRIHPNAVKAAEAAECARRQNRFWDVHDRLLKTQSKLTGEVFMDIAKASGLDVPAFASCLGGQGAGQVRADVAEATAIGVSGTPTFFIGRVRDDGRVAVLARLPGAVSAIEFETALDHALRPGGGLKSIFAAALLTVLIVGGAVWTARSRVRKGTSLTASERDPIPPADRPAAKVE